MSTKIMIDLSDYLEECKNALEDDGYKVFENDFDTVISDLAEYVKEMEKNLYVYSRKEFKSYEEIYNDLKRMVEENK